MWSAHYRKYLHSRSGFTLHNYVHGKSISSGLFLVKHVGVCCKFVSLHFSLVVTCWERADILAVVCVVFCHFPKCVLVRIRIQGEIGAVKLV